MLQHTAQVWAPIKGDVIIGEEENVGSENSFAAWFLVGVYARAYPYHRHRFNLSLIPY